MNGPGNLKVTTKITIRKMGNSQGVVIPNSVLTQLGLEGETEMSVERCAIVLRRPRNSVREGWAEASAAIAASGDEGLVWPEFANAGDAELVWESVARYGWPRRIGLLAARFRKRGLA